jgi:hypothetical protein
MRIADATRWFSRRGMLANPNEGRTSAMVGRNGQANRSAPAFLMALVALWAPPARCADATAADATAARVPIYDRLFAEVEFGGALNDSEKGATGLVGLPGHLPRIRRVGVPDNLQYRHRREHRARLSRRPVRPDKSRPEQLRIAGRIQVLSWRRRRRRALLVRLRLLCRQFVEVLENQIDVGGDLNRDYGFESGVQFG